MILVIFGIIGWVGIFFDIMIIIIVVIVMGIVVDDILYFVYSYCEVN